MTIESLMALAAAVFIFSLKPGPGIMTSVSYSLSHGWSGFWVFIAGFNVGLAVYLTIVFVGFLGVSYFDVDIVFISILVKSLAALYLIFLGFQDLQKWQDVGKTQILSTEKFKSFFDIFTSAIILTVSNSMIIVFYATLIPVFVNPELITLNIALQIMAILMIIDSFGMLIYCAPVLLFRKTIPKSFMKYTKLASAIILILIGLYIGYTAVPAADIMSVF